MNITDIDDKIIRGANAAGETTEALPSATWRRSSRTRPRCA
jgi:cysteinyl-tRNA synthetase